MNTNTTRYFTQTLQKQSSVLNTRYFIYCRKSTDEVDKQVLSIESQISELQEFALKENFKIIDILTENRTAKVPGRKIFDIMLDRIEKGEADGILSWHPDRLARNSVDGGRIIYLIDIGKIKDLKFSTFWFEPTPQGKFMLNIAFGQSKYYVDNLSENIKRGNRQKLRNGVWPKQAPIGYLNNRVNKTIEVNTNTAPLVKLAFKLYSEGNISLTKLCIKLFKLGLARKNNTPIKVDTVKGLLQNTFYFGLMKYNGEYYQGTHTKFITKELFDKVQEILNSKTFKVRARKHEFPFTGLMTCADCGAMITAEIGRGHHYYHCTYKKGPCSQRRFTREEILTKEFAIQLNKVSFPDYWADLFLQRLEKEGKWEKRRHKELIKRELGKLKEVEEKLSKLLDGYLNGLVKPEQYKLKQEELINKKVKLEENIKKFREGTSVWLEQMKEFILTANSARKASEGQNPFEIANFAKKAGSNITLKDKKVSFDLKIPWNLAGHAAARARPPNWWSRLDSNQGLLRCERSVLPLDHATWNT